MGGGRGGRCLRGEDVRSEETRQDWGVIGQQRTKQRSVGGRDCDGKGGSKWKEKESENF